MPRWRPITWAMIGWLSLFVIVSMVEDPGQALYLFLPFGLVVFIGLFGISQLTKPKARECPACGLGVQRGVTACSHCGFDFAAAASRAWHPPQT